MKGQFWCNIMAKHPQGLRLQIFCLKDGRVMLHGLDCWALQQITVFVVKIHFYCIHC